MTDAGEPAISPNQPDSADQGGLGLGDAPAAGKHYRVLARKYRPSSFEDLIGQDAVVRTVSNAFETGRIPQAWILTGVRGVGKTTTARILARALNYELPDRSVKGPTIHMPTLGVHCQAIMESRHMDVLEMDAASHTGVVDMRRVEADVLMRHLANIAAKESVEIEPEALGIIARAAEGSVRDSLSLLDQAIAHAAGKVQADAVRQMLGLADRTRVIDLFEQL